MYQNVFHSKTNRFNSVFIQKSNNFHQKHEEKKKKLQKKIKPIKLSRRGI